MSVNVSSERSRDALRQAHGVRLVDAREEGTAAADLPAGVYGFTSSPALASPLFAVRRYRNFEVHRLPGGPTVVGFVTPDEAARLNTATSEATQIRLFPDAEAEATVIVAIAYDRIVHHRQYSVLNGAAITLNVIQGAPHLVGA